MCLTRATDFQCYRQSGKKGGGGGQKKSVCSGGPCLREGTRLEGGYCSLETWLRCSRVMDQSPSDTLLTGGPTPHHHRTGTPEAHEGALSQCCILKVPPVPSIGVESGSSNARSTEVQRRRLPLRVIGQASWLRTGGEGSRAPATTASSYVWTWRANWGMLCGEARSLAAHGRWARQRKAVLGAGRTVVAAVAAAVSSSMALPRPRREDGAHPPYAAAAPGLDAMHSRPLTCSDFSWAHASFPSIALPAGAHLVSLH